MRYVVNTAEVAHLWANQTQEHARNKQGSVHFKWKLLYSYSTVIGQLSEDKDGRTWAFLSSKSLTPTTAKHVIASSRATSHLVQIYTPAFACWRSSERTIEEMLLPLYEELRKDFLKLPRMRTRLSWGIGYYERRRARLREAIAAFNIATIPDDLPVADGELREKAKAILLQNEEKEAAREAQWKRELQAEREERKGDFEAWLSGASVEFPYVYRGRTQYITIREGEVLTSLSARCPLADVRKALTFYDSRRLPSGGYTPFHTNGHIIRLGDFRLDAINEEGDVKAGCHTFTAAEIERFRNQWSTLLT